jgi:hypothetical protein
MRVQPHPRTMNVCGRAGALAGPDSARQDLRVGEGAHAPAIGEIFKAIRRLEASAGLPLPHRETLGSAAS